MAPGDGGRIAIPAQDRPLGHRALHHDAALTVAEEDAAIDALVLERRLQVRHHLTLRPPWEEPFTGPRRHGD